jgi:CubicO group peptidase (beta-lactamase class C family)
MEEALARIDEFVEREIAHDGPPGLAFAVTDATRTLAVRTYGYADLAARAPVQQTHLFQTGSTGKSFAAFMVMQEVEAGRLQLNVPVTEYLPWFKVSSRFGPITLHHLLAHTAGISTGNDHSLGAEGEVFGLRETEAAWAPGTRLYYSNAGYKTIGLILERVAGQPYAQLLRTRIFEPLGMHATEPAIVNGIRPRSAIGYHRLYDDRPDHRSRPWIPAPFSESTTADGSISSNVEDMAIYLRLLLNRGTGPSGPIVSESGFDYMSQRFAQDPDDPSSHFGFGLFCREVEGRTFFGHSGGTLGFTTGMWTEDGLGVIILQNSERGAMWAVPHVLGVMRAAIEGRELPQVPAFKDPTVVENAADYAGTYRCGERVVEVVQDDMRLSIDSVPLDRTDGDVFQVPHPDFDLFLLRFGREMGAVTEFVYGSEVFINARHSGFVDASPYPREWDSLVGHYRSHNPWCPDLRIFVQKGVLMARSAFDAETAELVLTQLPSGRFAMGDTPENVFFDQVIGERAMRAVMTNQEYFRTFTP